MPTMHAPWPNHADYAFTNIDPKKGVGISQIIDSFLPTAEEEFRLFGTDQLACPLDCATCRVECKSASGNAGIFGNYTKNVACPDLGENVN